ncbi:hypothetical protein MSP8887_03752 [Marinomonas spartinae]|uniref:Uncharacterized protein n=1 Tax=Marinomonas spartinae TaxID=1792290 RepID=A0A1A8TL19_9GAMM|nr:hypothetical protein MSP8886_02842 [Marinomonas spartinae]SBS39290.1 hypothetical protein MSP8887_03752 [Marinomonas spartinae]
MTNKGGSPHCSGHCVGKDIITGTSQSDSSLEQSRRC